MIFDPQHNLEYLAARHAQLIVKDPQATKPKELENVITNTLGVLQENGVYACFLYLLARENDASQRIIEQMRALLAALGIVNAPADHHLKYARDLTENLPTLLLAKEALEQLLIYARYGAKASGKP